MNSSRDPASPRVAPVVVVALIAANLAVFAHEVSLLLGDRDGGALTHFFDRFGLVPRELVRAVVEPGRARSLVWLTPLTSMFVHAGLVHLAGNLLYLWFFGRGLERVLGHARFALLYLLCGLVGAGLQVAADSGAFVPSVGASGAVSGVLGAALVTRSARPRLPGGGVDLPAALLVLAWVAIQLASTLEAGGGEDASVAGWAHVGGFASGLAAGRVLRPRGSDSALRSSRP